MEIVRDPIEFFLFFRGENFAPSSKDSLRQDRCARRKSLRLFFRPVPTSKLSSARHSQVPGLLPVHFVEHISRSSRRQSISGSFSYQIVFAGGQSQVTDALARSTSISRSIYEAVEQVLRASQLASFSSSSSKSQSLSISFFSEFLSPSFFVICKESNHHG